MPDEITFNLEANVPFMDFALATVAIAAAVAMERNFMKAEEIKPKTELPVRLRNKSGCSVWCLLIAARVICSR